MILETELVKSWPKLAWVAVIQRGTDHIHVRHGSHVEKGRSWCVEAVWTGDFGEGDFDLTDLVFGTGVRLRDGRIIFVTAGTMMDRLWHCSYEGRFFVSNTLPGLLACSGLNLLDGYLGYPDDMKTMREGLNHYKRTIPGSSADLNVVYYNNLVYEGSSVREVAKPDTSPSFADYEDYHSFLVFTARNLARNMEDSRRKHPIIPLSTLSTGYDSGATAAIAREAGCTKAVTITNASSLFPRSDSGLEIARYLDMDCVAYHHSPRAYKHEETVWSLAGRPAGLNLTIFDYPNPLSLLFTGFRGDSIWYGNVLDRPDPFWTFSVDGLALCEFRLIQGIFHCVVPFWGGQKMKQIQQINFQEDMNPWRLNSDYDRPIPRRIMEDAGVPRELFGNRKEATSAESFFHWPYTPEGRTSFCEYLKNRGFFVPWDKSLWSLRKIVHLDHLLYVNLTHRFGWHTKGLRFVFRFKGQQLLFQWANYKLKEMYQRELPGG